jgi:hypothetical protein
VVERGPLSLCGISPWTTHEILPAIDRSADMVDVLCSSGTAYEVTPKSTAFGANVLFSFFTRMPKT